MLVRTVLIVVACCTSVLLPAQFDLLINEIQAANRGLSVDADGSTPDWVELYNSGEDTLDLKGLRLSVAGTYHVIDESIRVPPHGYQLLWCSGEADNGADHLGFTLPRHGGTLLLIDRDGTTISDLFTWPETRSDESIGRVPDGAMEWSPFLQATPGGSNELGIRKGRAIGPVAFDPMAGVFPEQISVTLTCPEGGTIHYTLDGSPPWSGTGQVYQGPILLRANTVIRAMNSLPGSRTGNEQCATYVISELAQTGLCVVMDPPDLHGVNGIYDPGEHANNTRTGAEWERAAGLSFPDDPSRYIPIGARISGSGSRGLGKRSFKLYARDRYSSPREGLGFPDGTHFSEGILRADAGPHAFLRNSLVERMVLGHGLSVEVQPSTPYPLYLNGRYWGLYRWMPPKDAEWLRSMSGAHALDVLDGPSNLVLEGSDRHFRQALNALYSKVPMDSLGKMIDLESLIDLACVDLWTGRADHDINVRCYRPAQPDGRWRWVLFDMDLWAPASENSLERMCSAAVREAPYVPALLEHPQLREKLMARMSALLATAFDPVRALALLDSIYRQNCSYLEADHRRWELVLETPDPSVSVTEVGSFVSARPDHLLHHLSKRTGRKTKVALVEGPPPSIGHVLLEGVRLSEGRNTVHCFDGVIMTIEAVPAPGMEFAGWDGFDDHTSSIELDLSAIRSLKAGFRSVVP